MSDIIRTEHYLNDPLLPQLFLQSWKKKDGGSRGLFLITHGISEHSDCYNLLAHELAAKDWTVFGWDLIGHGRSSGPRGVIEHFNDFSKHLGMLVDFLKGHNDIKSSPLVAFGHSMGGLITTQYILDLKTGFPQACILSCPAFGLETKLSATKESAAQWMNQFFPSLTINNGLQFDHLSRDPKMVASYRTDSLRHRKISAPLYLGMKAAQVDVGERMHSFGSPLLMQSAGRDTTITTSDCIEFYKKVPQPKKLHIYEESFHEIYNDINRQEVIDHLHQYLGELGL